MVRRAIKYGAAFTLTVLVLTVLLIGAAKIPNSAVQKKMVESGEYFNSKEQVEYLTEGVLASQLHYSADATWCSIAYNLDSEHPIESIMWAYFSLWEGENYNGGFYQSVLHEAPGKLVQYLRYWHGAAAILRFLHLFWNIQQIYVFMCVMISSLLITLLSILCRNKMNADAISLILSIIMVSIWIVPLCLEYVWMFLITLVGSIIAVRLSLKERTNHFSMLFFLIGIIAAYLDFLTTETITLLIPLLLIMRVAEIKNEAALAAENWKLSAKSCFAWLIGFLGMWMMKWVIASIVLGENVMPYVRGHIEERLGGSVGLSPTEFLFQAVVRNVRRLFVFDYGMVGAVALCLLIIVLIVVPVCLNKVKVRKTINKKQVLLYTVLGLIPYVRYLVLHNHSYGHYCFTYRAQAATILALCFIILELVEPVKSYGGAYHR